MEYFMTELPLDSSSMTRWRKRTGPKGFEAMLKESLETALRMKYLKPKELNCVIVDTTVQENDITFPTDLKLYAKGIELLVRGAKRAGMKL
ncbi:MAG: IS5/IS1182 family transposase, partial [Cloacibacillus evryensis]|nr:IS5/IS1182 family transposase [Cloacibacillus evryensis]